MIIQKESASPKICILVDRLRVSSLKEGSLFYGWENEYIANKLKSAGVRPSDVCYASISNSTDRPTMGQWEHSKESLNKLNLQTLVTMDEWPMTYATGKRTLDKWHLSPLKPVQGLEVSQVIPTFHIDQIRKQWHLGFYLERALQRAREIVPIKEKRFRLNPDFEETIAILESLQDQEHLSIDIETGAGQINTMGFAWTKHDAIAIQVLPERLKASKFHKLWDLIRVLMENDSKKIAQNSCYEKMYLSLYGINVRGMWHDTMAAQKLLYPEFDKGLGNVGRLFTNEPYWKDTGKVFSEESGKRDWSNIKDWPKHFEYNCLDTSGTFEAAFNQKRELEQRGLDKLFYSFVMKFAEPSFEMCERGLPVNQSIRKKLLEERNKTLEENTKALSKEINPKSWKQKLKLLKDKGYKIPKKRKPDGTWGESTDELSLKKLRLKHPEDTDLQLLLKISKDAKAASSYLDIGIRPDNRVRFMLDFCSTETWRWSSSNDPWYGGFNAQTIPKYAKKMIEWPGESGRVFVQCDLKQAESRFVAYDSCDWDLIKMLEDPAEDIHSYVAAEIFKVPYQQVRKEHATGNSSKRQLGKKSGHGANYSMRETTFMESCLKEMDLVLSKAEAKNVLESYHKLFPGIRRWHGKIRDTLHTQRRLVNPFGAERWFYGRMDDDTFREAYAFLPQSTIPMVTNSLLLGLAEQRNQGALDFWFHLQVHDSVVVSCLEEEVPKIAAYMSNYKLWHPRLPLSAGDLWIPTDVEWGRNLGKLQPWKGHL